MRILIVSQYFWPENFKINDLVLGLKERGHDITVLTGKPNYPKGAFPEGYSFWKKGDETWNGIKIIRANLLPRGKSGAIRLILNFFSFAVFASLKKVKEPFDLIFVYEPSPVTVGIPAVFLKRKHKVPVYFWVQDLWPHTLTAAVQIENKLILNFADALTKWIYKHCNKILVQSEGFIDYIASQGISKEKIIFYPNSTEAYFKPVIPSQSIRDLIPANKFTVMFAGNIGESQDFDTVLEAAKKAIAVSDKIQFVVLGDGRKKKFVEQKVEEFGIGSNFLLLGAFPSETMPEFFACADALLVSLKNDRVFDLTIPSKIQSYLACKKPLIGSLNGEGARVIEEAKAGVVAPAGDPDILAKRILELYEADADKIHQMKEAAGSYFENNFEREMLLGKLESILQTGFNA